MRFKIIIPVKGESIRLANKNALPFGDKNTLLEWKISQLLEVFEPSDIVVSTDFEPFKEIARKSNLLLHERQNPSLSNAKNVNYKFSNLIYDIFSSVEAQHFAWIPVTSPLMSSKDYKNCFDAYQRYVIDFNQYDSLITTQLQKEFFWDESKSINYDAGENHIESQDLPNWYRITNGMFIISKELGLEYKYFAGRKPYKFEVSKLSGFDIDTQEDYELCNALYPLYKSKLN